MDNALRVRIVHCPFSIVHSVKPSLSIIIPTHRRGPTLIRCLQHLEAQTIAKQIEVIVVSDGSDSETEALMKHASWNIPVTFFVIPKSQQGTARNRGVEKAKADRILFIGDDAFLAPDACAKYLESPAGVAMLGFTTWDPSVGVTSVMTWLEASGWQFGYSFLEPFRHRPIDPEIQHKFTYTIHLSLPTALAKQHPFREDVSLYGWEDIEWGWRLAQAGIPLFYEPDAKALHHHRIDLEQSLKRMKTLGESAIVMNRINPALDLVPRGLKLWKYRIAALLPTLRGRHAKAFLRGLQGLQR